MDLNTEIWDRLLRGRDLNDLGLASRNGRLDLASLFLPQPSVERRFRTKVADVSVLSKITKVDGVEWNSLDFTGARLNGLLFFGSSVVNCVFDGSACQQWGL
jgi:hypothetical protein